MVQSPFVLLKSKPRLRTEAEIQIIMTQELEKIAEQAGGMMLTDHTEEEVRDWLQVKKRITGSDADQIVKIALNRRRKVVRFRALLRVIFSGVGMLLFSVFLFLQYAGSFIIVGISVFIVWGVGLFSFVIFARSVIEFISGNTKRPLN